jgi:hypothetical protein
MKLEVASPARLCLDRNLSDLPAGIHNRRRAIEDKTVSDHRYDRRRTAVFICTDGKTREFGVSTL